MSIISELEKLSSRKLYFYSSIITALVSMGTLFIFVFNQDLFFKLDIFKLLLLSFAITSPVYILNCFIIITLIPREDLKFFLVIMSTGAMLTVICISVLILFNVFFETNIKTTIFILLLLEILCFAAGKSVMHDERKREEKQKK